MEYFCELSTTAKYFDFEMIVIQEGKKKSSKYNSEELGIT